MEIILLTDTRIEPQKMIMYRVMEVTFRDWLFVNLADRYYDTNQGKYRGASYEGSFGRRGEPMENEELKVYAFRLEHN